MIKVNEQNVMSLNINTIIAKYPTTNIVIENDVIIEIDIDQNNFIPFMITGRTIENYVIECCVIGALGRFNFRRELNSEELTNGLWWTEIDQSIFQ